MFESLKKIPLHLPDTGGYESYADRILAGGGWFHEANIADVLADITVLRMPLYPLIIAIHKYLFGAWWDVALVLTQMGVAVIALYFLLQLCAQLKFSRFQLWMVGLIYAFGWPGYITLTVLVDSLFTSLSLILLCTLFRYVLDPNRRINYGLLLTLPAVMYLTREMAPYFLLAMGPLFVAIYLAGSLKKTVLILTPILISLSITHGALGQWNVYRTGERFVSLGFATPAMYALIKPQEAGGSILKDTVLADYESEFKEYSFGEGVSVLIKMAGERHLNMITLSSMMKKDYLTSWILHPSARLKYSLNELHRGIIFDVVSPFQVFGSFFYNIEGEKIPHFRHLKKGEWGSWPIWGLVVFVFTLLSRVLSAVLLVSFLSGVIRDRRNLMMLSSVGFCLIYIGIYAAIHLEMRYIIPVLSLTSIGGIYYFKPLWRRHA